MTHAIIRGKNGRRYEVDFGDSPVRVEVHQILKRMRKNGDVLP
jgi:hypothetical protein